MRWLPELHVRPGMAAVLLGQLSQRSTIMAIINAVVLIAGWTIAPARIEALGTLLSVLDAIALAVIQEKPSASAMGDARKE